jgi:hypothetical protein
VQKTQIFKHSRCCNGPFAAGMAHAGIPLHDFSAEVPATAVFPLVWKERNALTWLFLIKNRLARPRKLHKNRGTAIEARPSATPET